MGQRGLHRHIVRLSRLEPLALLPPLVVVVCFSQRAEAVAGSGRAGKEGLKKNEGKAGR